MLTQIFDIYILRLPAMRIICVVPNFMLLLNVNLSISIYKLEYDSAL